MISFSKFVAMLMIVVVALLTPTCWTLPKQRYSRDGGEPRSLVGVSTNIITSSLLKGAAESTGNHVFSPFGFSSILTMISEGAEGQTLKELYDVFKFPTDRDLVRRAYDESLKRLSGQNPANEPQFKTWFYIYKNNSVHQAYKDVLERNYGVEVRDIERNDYDFDEPKTSLEPVVADVEDEKVEEVIEEEITEESNNLGGDNRVTEQEGGNSNNSKDIVDFEVLKIKSALPVDDAKDDVRIDTGITTNYDEIEDENPKFDKNIDDKEYVDPTKIKAELAKQKMDAMNEVLEQGETNEKVKSVAADSNNQEPAKLSLPLKKLGAESDELEIMQLSDSNVSTRKLNLGRSFLTGDIASALSGNSLVGRKLNAKQDDPQPNESKMLLFNGLYYRGAWATPFQQLRTEESMFFTNTEEKPVMMMRSQGTFGIGKDDQLDAKFLELPYNNSRYSLLLMVPNSKDGLKELIKNFNPDTLSTVQKSLVQMPAQICIPKFRIDTTSRAEKPLAKLGLITMFTSKADLSGITDEQKIHVDELVQHVSIRVDEGSSSENALSATNTIEAKTLENDREQFLADKPFLFFVRDIVDDIVIVAGKITDVPYAE
ncbi:antithrombin-III [Anopheles darlingi]|uniref:antithrombin-III n=1 Tax=Anopheles darlingi TaxID=43151 RepID=UPI0021005CE7|nr:antithrombin-III [Anopheles darlingi]